MHQYFPVLPIYIPGSYNEKSVQQHSRDFCFQAATIRFYLHFSDARPQRENVPTLPLCLPPEKKPKIYKKIVVYPLQIRICSKWNILFDKMVVHYKLSIRYIETIFKGTLQCTFQITALAG
jgi:hypothetical protein